MYLVLCAILPLVPGGGARVNEEVVYALLRKTCGSATVVDARCFFSSSVDTARRLVTLPLSHWPERSTSLYVQTPRSYGTQLAGTRD